MHSLQLVSTRTLSAWIITALLIGAAYSAPGQAQDPADAAGQRAKAAAAVDDQLLRESARHAGNWMATSGDQAETRYSELDQINTTTTARLGLLWSRDLGTRRGVEATPIVVDGTMYFTTPWSVVHAVDASNGQELWQWDPQVDKAVFGRRACCDVVNRGVAIYKGMVFVGVLDGRLAALDAATGRPLWQTLTVDQSKNYTITGAPRIVDGKVIIGNGGADLGVRGYVSAYEAMSGTLAWRTWVVPGNPADGFESPALAKAAKTWTGEWWKSGGGGSVWDTMAYDPELKLLYVGTGNGAPWNRRHRSPGGGDNLFLASILALRPDTGEIVWHFQTTPGDTWDYTATQSIVLADIKIDGRLRKVLMQAPKNGFFYVLDRETGQFISARNYVDMTWADGIDPVSGRPIERAGMDYSKAEVLVKPGSYGAHNWQPMAFNRDTGLVYIPAQDFQERYADDPSWSDGKTLWTLGLHLMGSVQHPPEGALLAWDPVRQREAWRVSYPIGWNGGVLTTGGGLVFQGTGDGRLVAYDARSGKVMWQRFVGTAIIASPVTYTVQGKQYVTVIAGWGGSYGLYNPPAGEAARYEQTGRIFTFALDADSPAPPLVAKASLQPGATKEPLSGSEEEVQRGEALYMEHCSFCHGQGGVLPDLRYISADTRASFNAIVYDGAFAAAKGMPAFRGTLTEQDVRAIHLYLISESQKLAVSSGGY